MERSDIEAYSWVVRGKQRRTILSVMDKPKTPTQITEQTHFKFSNVSDVLRAMTEEGLATCLNPKEKTGRLYKLTRKGEKVQKELKSD